MVDAFKAQGALWGGDYHGCTDPMHFEFCSREAVAKPVGLLDVPEADGDSEAGGQDEAAPAASDGDKSSGGVLAADRNWLVAAGSSIGLGGIGALTNWQIAAVLFAFVFLAVVSTVAFIIIFFGAEPVRQWVRRHVT